MKSFLFNLSPLQLKVLHGEFGRPAVIQEGEEEEEEAEEGKEEDEGKEEEEEDEGWLG